MSKAQGEHGSRSNDVRNRSHGGSGGGLRAPLSAMLRGGIRESPVIDRVRHSRAKYEGNRYTGIPCICICISGRMRQIILLVEERLACSTTLSRPGCDRYNIKYTYKKDLTCDRAAPVGAIGPGEVGRMELARTRRALSVASHVSRKITSIIQSTCLVRCSIRTNLPKACWQPTAVKHSSVCLWIASRSWWIAVQERSLSKGSLVA